MHIISNLYMSICTQKYLATTQTLYRFINTSIPPLSHMLSHIQTQASGLGHGYILLDLVSYCSCCWSGCVIPTPV